MRKKKASSAAKTRPSSDCATYLDCLEQAEICREQARAAARLKRFKAARGLFSTAIALCRQAMLLGGEACSEAKDRLRQLNDEMLAYTELAKSMERPFLMRVEAPAQRPAPPYTQPYPPSDLRSQKR